MCSVFYRSICEPSKMDTCIPTPVLQKTNQIPIFLNQVTFRSCYLVDANNDGSRWLSNSRSCYTLTDFLQSLVCCEIPKKGTRLMSGEQQSHDPRAAGVPAKRSCGWRPCCLLITTTPTFFVFVPVHTAKGRRLAVSVNSPVDYIM